MASHSLAVLHGTGQNSERRDNNARLAVHMECATHRIPAGVAEQWHLTLGTFFHNYRAVIRVLQTNTRSERHHGPHTLSLTPIMRTYSKCCSQNWLSHVGYPLARRSVIASPSLLQSHIQSLYTNHNIVRIIVCDCDADAL